MKLVVAAGKPAVVVVGRKHICQQTSENSEREGDFGWEGSRDEDAWLECMHR